MIKFLVPSKRQGGVFDYSLTLKQEIGDELVSIVPFAKDTRSGWPFGSEDVIILQFSGYGFDKRGTPLWLLREIEDRRNQIKNFGVFFHELYAFGRPWSSSFWLSPVQRYIARRLVEVADFWITNRDGSAQWLSGVAGRKPHAVLPVFSNVGESGSLAQPRLPRIVVFGSPVLRQNTYRAAGAKLFDWAKKNSLEVHDIGAPIEEVRMAETLRAYGVVQHGALGKNVVSLLMEQAMFGLLAYPVHVIAKSSVFAAYCAHGLCPILISDSYEITDGLIPLKHYLPDFPFDTGAAVTVSEVRGEAWSWYQTHNVAKHADVMRGFMGLYTKHSQADS